MLYLKATIVGLLSGLLLAIAALFLEAQVKMSIAMRASASGGIGSVSAGMESAGPAFLIGFVGAVYWIVRRSRRRPLGA